MVEGNQARSDADPARVDSETASASPDLAVVVSRIVCAGLCGAAAEGPNLAMGLRAAQWRCRGDQYMCPDCACVWCLGSGLLFTGVMCKACAGTGLSGAARDREGGLSHA